jgi:hydroxymethylpyrimidine/phosphomethylpyrimidine kinase
MSIAGRPYVLSVAGYDPCGGAGVLADIKTFEQADVYGMAVNTATTCQTEDSYQDTFWLPWYTIEGQLLPLLARYPFAAAKVGLVENMDTLKKILATLRAHFPDMPIVWDTILSASAGQVFHDEIQADELNEILGMTTVITPNWDEARVLGKAVDGLYAARNLCLYTHVLLKGGHMRENKGTDFLLTREGDTRIFVAPSAQAPAKHGSGCVFSAALTAGLGKGLSLDEACQAAKKYTFLFLHSGPGLLGIHAL